MNPPCFKKYNFIRMKIRSSIIIIMLVCLSVGIITYAQDSNSGNIKFSTGLVTGYNRGYAIQANITLYNFADVFPFELRFAAGYTFLNPGNAADARRIFINNATNGVPEKKGGSFDFRFDVMLRKSFLIIDHSYIVFGPRFASFKGNFKFIGGNEDFDVVSKQWGLGGGIENHFKMTQLMDLVFVFGLDYYFPSTLKGHDTSYSPDNDNVNPREDIYNDDQSFTYKDADKAIRQPRLMPRAMVGLSFNL